MGRLSTPPRAGFLSPIALVVLLAAGCADPTDIPTGALPSGPAYGKTADTNIYTTFKLPNPGSDLELRSDGKYLTADGAWSLYAHRKCGINSKIFYGDGASGDAIMHTSNPTFKDPKCRDYPRKVHLSANSLGEVEIFLNVRSMHKKGSEISVGAEEFKVLAINPETGACTRFLLKDANAVRVYRSGTGAWEVSSQPAPNNVAVCESDGSLHPMDVAFTVVAQ